MIKICIVCHGNICRSPMAEFMLKQMAEEKGINNLKIFSRATSVEEIGNNIYNPAKKCLRNHKVPYKTHHAKQITKSEFKNADYVLIMDERNQKSLERMFQGLDFTKVSTVMSYAGFSKDVADPWYTGDFEKTYFDLKIGLDAFLNYITM